MSLRRKLLYRLFELLQKKSLDVDMEQEMRSHIEMQTQENSEAGMNPEQARYAALRQFGQEDSIKETCRDQRGFNLVETLTSDIRLAVRMLRKNPGFATVAVLTLALGIGANTAIFSCLNAVLLRPLSYPDANRLVRIASVNPTLGIGDSRSSDPNILDWRDRSTSFEKLAAFQEWDGVLTMDGRSESVRVNWTTPDLLSLLGIHPVQGRLLMESDDVNSGVLLPDGVWERFGRNPKIIGATLKLNGEPATVVGILPPNVAAPAQGTPALNQVFLAADLRRSRWPRGLELRNVVGRLKPGVTVAQAQQELSGIAADLQREFPDTNRGWGVRVTDLKQWQTNLVRGQLLVVYGATVVILLIACLNVSNLLLIRGEIRRKELAIREALGSTRLRLVRHLLVESLLLSFAGAAIGVLLGSWCERALVAFAPAFLGIREIKMDPAVLISALGATVLAALLSGLLPVLRVGRANLTGTLAEAGRSTSPGKDRHRMLNILVVGQIGVSTALLFAACLALVSFQKLMRVDPGFATHNVICFRVGTLSKSSNGQRVIDSLSALPGVQAVGGANIELLDDVFSNGIRIASEDSAQSGGWISGTVDAWHATTDYFIAAGIPLQAGRTFASEDGYDVVIVNEALAKRFFPNRDPVGRSFHVPWTNFPGPPKRVIGLVGSIKQRGLRQAEVPIYYMHLHMQDMDHLALAVRTRENAQAIIPVLREAIRKVDPELVMNHVSTTEGIVTHSLSSQYFAAVLMTGFATLGLLLAAVGLYGVISYTVTQRTHEIGVRMALGAKSRDVLHLVLRRGLRLIIPGAAFGLLGGMVIMRWANSMRFQVSAVNPIIAGMVGLFMCAVALLACWLPAHRAARVDPMKALRDE
jgi:predicted permease